MGDDEAALRVALAALRLNPAGGLPITLCYGAGATPTVVAAFRAVLDAMTTHPTEFYVVVNGCAALGRMMSGSGAKTESIRAAVGDAGGIDALLAVLRAIRLPEWEVHLPLDGDQRPRWRLDALHGVACKALASACSGGFAAVERNARRAIAAGALDGLLAWPGLGDPEEDFTPHGHTYMLLEALLRDSNDALRENACVAAAAAGVPAALASLLVRAAAKDAERALHACVSLHTLAGEDAACAAAVGAAGAVEGVLTALQAHPAEVQLVKFGLAALTSLFDSKEDGNARRAVAGGVGAVIVATMRVHASVPYIQLHGLLAVRYCLEQCGDDAERAASAAGAAGALCVIAAAMRMHTANPILRSAAVDTLCSLMAAEDNAARMHAAGVPELLVAGMARRAHEWQMSFTSCAVHAYC
jgi:hypothetical protein